MNCSGIHTVLLYCYTKPKTNGQTHNSDRATEKINSIFNLVKRGITNLKAFKTPLEPLTLRLSKIYTFTD